MLVVGIGGTLRPGSSSETALRLALAEVGRLGAKTMCFSGPQLALPLYDPSTQERSTEARALIGALREADGVILSSPSYHGLVSGLVKNALDYVEDMARDPRVYLDGVPVGCIGVGFGHQGAVAAMTALRSVAHALRGWVTPYGCTVQSAPGLFADGRCADERIEGQLRLVGEQVARFAQAWRNGDACPDAAAA